MTALRFAPSTNSMTMKYALSPTPMSKTCTQFECESCAERRASSRNIAMNFFFSERCGRTRLIATCFLKPLRPSLSARNTSAMPPDSSFSTTRYRCCWSAMPFTFVSVRGVLRPTTMRNALAMIVLGGCLLGTGCYADAQAGGAVTVEADVAPAPPPVQVEVQPVSPGPEFVWVGGYHRWVGGRYVWVGGRYDRRPRVGAAWRAAHWERRGRRQVWIEARWD